jgi:hypothetical protein
MSPEDLNTALVEQFKRLGAGDEAKAKINAAMQQFGGKSVNDVAVDQRNALIEYVKGLQ